MGKISKHTFIVDVATDKDDFEDYLKEQLKESYNKAIDDFADRIKEMYAFTILEEEQLDEMAKQLKESR